MRRKNILSSVIMLFAIAIMSTGCVKSNVDITFDNKDNMKVETTVLYPQEITNYIGSQNSYSDLTKDIQTKIEGIDVDTKTQEIENKQDFGTRKIESCRKISKAKKVEKLSIIVPQNPQTSILKVNNYWFFKKYVLNGKIEEAKEFNSTGNEFGNIKANDIISTKIRIKVPSLAKCVKTNASVIDVDNPGTYVWKIDYSKTNPITTEFCMINWYAVILTIVFMILLIFCFFYFKNGSINLSIPVTQVKKIIKFNLQGNSKLETTPRNISQTEQSLNPIKIVIVLTISLAIFLTITYFSLPAICEILVENSIKSVYIGETAKATKMIEVANALNLDKNRDLSKDIFEKGISEIEKNDNTTAKAFFKLVAKTKTNQGAKYSEELTDKALKALKQNELGKSQYLIEAAIKFDEETAKKITSEYSKKYLSLFTEKKYQEALLVSDILILLNSKNHENWFRKGLTLINLNKNKEAIEALTNAINLRKDFGVAYMNRGLIYFNNLSEYDKAIYDFNQVINFSFDKRQLAIARLNLARIYLKKNDYRKAMDDAWTAKDLYYALGNLEMSDESYRVFDYAAELECNRPKGYCYY